MYILTDLLIIFGGMFLVAWLLAGLVNWYLDNQRDKRG